MNGHRRQGPPQTGPARELIDSGFAIENEDAPFLHAGLNLADLAHVLDLRRRAIVPDEAARALLELLLEVHQMPAEDFPYDPAYGEPYNSREHYFVSRLGNVAGWMHAGRPRREAARIAMRLQLRRQLLALVEEVVGFAATVTDRAEEHVETVMPDQTYLQQAQPSTLAHYLLSFVYPALRDADRMLDELGWVNSSPGGAGCVNGTRLQDDRSFVARSLGFDEVIVNTRDAMWQVDGLIHILATGASMLSNFSKLGEDLEIWSSSEFDFVDLADSYSRASVLMPNKRNPYSLSIVRGASGVLIGRLTGFLAVTKSPSARSDNLIFAYGEVPRALDLCTKITRLITGVVDTLRVNADRLRAELGAGYTQATDLAEHLVRTAGVDYRTAYVVVGEVVRDASRRDIPGAAITAEMIEAVALERTGRRWGITDADLAAVLDPWQIVLSRTAEGGAAPARTRDMITDLRAETARVGAAVTTGRERIDEAETRLLRRARSVVDQPSSSSQPGPPAVRPEPEEIR